MVISAANLVAARSLRGALGSRKTAAIEVTSLVDETTDGNKSDKLPAKAWNTLDSSGKCVAEAELWLKYILNPEEEAQAGPSTRNNYR